MNEDMAREYNRRRDEAAENLEQTQTEYEIPDEELAQWANLPEFEGEDKPEWRRRLDDPEGWRELPIFMESIPENSDNPQVQALADIMYNDASPEEIAESSKSRGNVAMKQAAKATGGTAGPRGCYRTAVAFYTEGLDAKGTDDQINAALLANRAQAHLGLENYGHCVADCQDSLRLRQDVKCYFRASKACIAVKKPERALKFISRGLSLPGEEGNKALLGQQKVANELIKTLERIQKEGKRKQRDEVAQWYESVQLLVDSGIKVKKSELQSQHWAQYGAQGPHLEEGVLNMSMLFVYDEYNQSDFIHSVLLEHSIFDHIANMFPPEVPPPAWDDKSRYTASSLTAFYQVGYKKVEVPDLGETFGTLLRRKDYECPGFLPTFHIIPKDAEYAKKWRAGEEI
eukprot:TRINITY_DN1079_c1_g2_i1.p1 TRINITY_DN1079_c1_g2~~TRINITY_DN1079_c1_g2_i1.p1  ORF type:complete len:425 (+),score=109.03 TRINITY_DN1079_c1_g2_i1:73-1275(+)